MQQLSSLAALCFAIFFFSCDSKPKVIEPESGGAAKTPIFQDAPGAAGTISNAPASDMSEAEHKVVIQEALNTERYTYLRVKENDEEFWIAITKRPVKKGGTAYFKGGLLKKDFLSKEFNRTFETLYLVGDFHEEGEQAGAANIPSSTASLEPPKNLQRAAGAIKISDLVANIQKYAGKTVLVTGKCVKINPMIMGRNWVHLQDGSGKNLDLLVTTTEKIDLGAIVTMEGVVTTNKDFGAGYRYDYLLESGVLK